MGNTSNFIHHAAMWDKSSIDDEAVGLRLEALRLATGLKKGEFADGCGIDPSSYSKIIKGEKPLNSQMAFKLSNKWNVPMDYFYRGTLDRIPSNWLATIMSHLNGKN